MPMGRHRNVQINKSMVLYRKERDSLLNSFKSLT